MSIDQHRVAKVVDDQVVQIDDAVKRADDAVEQAGKAVDSSNVNKAAIDAANSAIAEAKTAAESAIAATVKNATAIDQNKSAISLKADQTTVDTLNKTVTDNSAAVSVLNDEIKLKVDTTTVNKIVDGKGFATTNTVQSLVDQKASQISQTIADVKTTVDGNGNAISAANDKISNLTQAIDGFQTTVKNKADQSQITQLANALQVKLSGSIIAQAADVTLTYTGKENEYPPAAPLVGMNDVDKGSTLILSFDYVASADTKLTPQLDGDPWIPWGDIVNATPAAKGEKGSYSKTITVNDDSWQKGNAKNLCIRCDGFKGTIEITNLVLKYADTTLNDVQSSFDMLRDDINLRVTKGDLISQINLEAGGDGLISVQNGKGKLMLDADSVVFGNKAFIPSAQITDINADQITTGTLTSVAINNGNGAFTVNPAGDVTANSMFLRNGTVFNGNVIGANLYAIKNAQGSNLDEVDDSKQSWFKINGQMIEWHRADTGSYTSIGTGLTIATFNPGETQPTETSSQGLAIADTNEIDIGIGDLAQYSDAHWDDHRVEQEQNMSWMFPTNLQFKPNLVRVNLRPAVPTDTSIGGGDIFAIQKNDCIGAYFGQGNNGNQINLVTSGSSGGGVNVSGDFHVTGSKNSIVNTKQGYLAINAYETAEYYFGDIGESNTGETCQVIIGIDQIFNETVNTDIQYQVFVTPYSDAHVWVKERYNNRFVVCSDKPNAEFGWELKAKRKGYESNRLRRVNVDVNPLQLKGETK